jgi:TonB family protein
MARTARATPADFLRSLEAFGRGGESLPRLREQIAAILAADPRHARLIATLVERARDEGRLPAPAAAALLRPARAALVEDLPTDWPDRGPGAGPDRATPAGPATGTVLKDRFELLEAVGGTQARVYRARDRRRAEAGSTAPWVAVKLVPASGDPRAVAALRREALLGARLSHPGIVRVHDLDRDGEWLFLTLEWLDGESLDRVLGQRGDRPLPRVQALPIVEGLCRALAHAHAEGVVHGDVKPGNVFLAADGRTRLLDFGAARDLGADAPGPAARTPAFASPAILAGAAPTPADDLFAAAGVAYRLLAGAPPFGAQTAAEAAAAGARPAPVASLTPAQWRALDRALAFDAAGRPADVTRFLAELKGPRDEGAAGAPGPAADAATGSVAAADPGAAARPGRTVIGLAGAGAVAAIAVVAGWLLGEPPPATQPTERATEGATERVTAPVAPAPATRDEAATATPPAAAESGATATRATPAGAGTASTGPARPASRAAPPAPVPPPAPAAAPAAPAAVAGNGTGPAPLPPAAPLAPAPSSAPAPAPDPSPAPAARSPAPAATLAALDPGPAIARGAAGSGADLPAAPPAADAGSGEVAGEVAFSSLRLRRYVEADYPRTAAAMRRSGWVEVGFRVAADGRPGDLRVLAAEPAGRFDAAALAAVRRWRFAPPPAGSEPRTRVRLRFEP